MTLKGLILKKNWHSPFRGISCVCGVFTEIPLKSQSEQLNLTRGPGLLKYRDIVLH
jgi:hypothetical protein